MATTWMQRLKRVFQKQDFGGKQLLEQAAEHGAKKDLADVGLEGGDAAHDIRELRGLLGDSFRSAPENLR